jgi:AraC-like DNA-binding protein
MKVVEFRVPHSVQEAFRVQIDHLPYFYDHLHQHEESQIMWIQEGEGTLVADDFVGRFGPGDVYFIGSRQPHVFRCDAAYYEPTSTRHARAVSVYINRQHLGDTFWSLDEMSDIRNLWTHARGGKVFFGETRKKIINCLESLPHTTGTGKLITLFEILHLLTVPQEAQSLSATAALGGSTTYEGKRINDVMQFTFKEYHRKIYINEVAQLANLSPEAFCRYFKLHTRKTYTGFLNEVRVSQACKLLIENKHSVLDICYKTGFSNLSNFNRTFKRITSMPPSKYANR